jgi:hypothetical protein
VDEVEEPEMDKRTNVGIGITYYITPRPRIEYAQMTLSVSMPILEPGFYKVTDVTLRTVVGLCEPFKAFSVTAIPEGIAMPTFHVFDAYNFVAIGDMLGKEIEANDMERGQEYYITPVRPNCQLQSGVYKFDCRLDPYSYHGVEGRYFRFKVFGSERTYGINVYKFYELRKEGTIVNEGRTEVEVKEQVIEVVVVADSLIIFQGMVLATSQNAARDKVILDNCVKLKEAKQYKVLTKPF